MNALVGTKVAITSSRPQTTRRAIRGIVHRPDAQLIIVDTPGLHRPRTLLGERLDSLVRSTLTEVDVIGFCLPATDPIGPGDKYLAAELARLTARTPVAAIVTKTDQATPPQVAAQLAAVAELGDWADIVPVSATAGFQLDVLADVLVSHLPPGRPLYPDGELTDEPEQMLVAELIREAVLEGVRDELPHSIAVVVEEMKPREGRDDLIDVYAFMYVERPSQKSIVIGAQGRPAEGGRHPGAAADRGPAGHQGLPGPAHQGGQGLAAGPETAAPAGLLRLSRQPAVSHAGRRSALRLGRLLLSERHDARNAAAYLPRRGPIRPAPSPRSLGVSAGRRPDPRGSRSASCLPSP